MIPWLDADDAYVLAQADKWHATAEEVADEQPPARRTAAERFAARMAWLEENDPEFLQRFPDGVDPSQTLRPLWGHWNDKGNGRRAA